MLLLPPVLPLAETLLPPVLPMLPVTLLPPVRLLRVTERLSLQLGPTAPRRRRSSAVTPSRF